MRSSVTMQQSCRLFQYLSEVNLVVAAVSIPYSSGARACRKVV